MWADQELWFEQERLRLRGYLSEDVAVEHIGSTAVHGLLAKPIVDVDIMVGVRSNLRYRGRRWFNASIIPFGDTLWENNIGLREILRSSASARRRYAQAKLDAINKGCVRLSDYSTAKSPTIEALLDEVAQRWRAGGHGWEHHR